ncbi:MAG: hypothetical protein DRN14_06990 [Thermoplasmata archaeon]|nr:MAG: hypothetical protein DRN14_06990 [Thermoplasmata archaeon]
MCMQKMECDILVVGAGAAGVTAALTALRNNLETVILERMGSIGCTNTRLDITESVGIEKIVSDLDLPIHNRSNRSRWFSPSYMIDYTSRIYDIYVKRGMDKDSFETISMARILDKGGYLLTNSFIKGIEWKNGAINEVEVKSNNKTIQIKPSFVIGADGTNSTILRFSPLSAYRHVVGEFRAVGIYGRYFDLPEGVTYVFFDKTIAPGGYIFVAKTRNEEGILGVGFDSSVASFSPINYLKKALNHHLLSKITKSVEILNRFQGFGKYGILKRHAIGNLMLAGDAGMWGEPFLCYGLRGAILSGYNAAKVCKLSIESSLDGQPANYYESSLREFQNKIKLDLLLRKIFKKLDNDDLDTIIKILADAKEEGLDLDYLFKRNNFSLIKHILKNVRGVFPIVFKAFSAIF